MLHHILKYFRRTIINFNKIYFLRKKAIFFMKSMCFYKDIKNKTSMIDLCICELLKKMTIYF